MRIAIVNDMILAQEALRRVVQTVPQYQIAWIAKDGAEAIAKSAEDTPDLILMDLVMPNLDGVRATQQIMQQSPCAILIVTATVEGHTSQVFEAMGYGALDVVSTPILGLGNSTEGGIHLLAKIKTIGKLLGKGGTRVSPIPRSSLSYPLVVLGASTGGPQALATILSALKPSPNAAWVVIQHVDQQFAPGFVQWLNSHSALPVQLAQEGTIPQPDQVLVAGTNDHLVMKADRRLAYSPYPQEYVYRPSVDVFFQSVARYWPTTGVGVLLTGMGRDGAIGLQALRQAGWYTIAQDQDSCVVYGMPKAALNLNAAVDILPLPEIARAIVKNLRLKTP